jgi:rod shape determining protein RodA
MSIFVGLFFSWPVHKRVKIIAAVLLVTAIPLSWLFMQDYQRQRIYTFISPENDPYGAGYNVIQSVIAVGSGGIWGRGLGNGPQSQLNFLPVSHTDFIFAGWSEATGLAGSLALILALLILNWRIYNVAQVSKDDFARYIGIGIGIIFSIQIAVNIGMNIGIAPVTGIPLPFVSHGGTAMIMDFAALGLLQSIYVRNKK